MPTTNNLPTSHRSKQSVRDYLAFEHRAFEHRKTESEPQHHLKSRNKSKNHRMYPDEKHRQASAVPLKEAANCSYPYRFYQNEQLALVEFDAVGAISWAQRI